MTLNEYEKFVESVAKPMQEQEVPSHILDMLHCVVGITGEAGELADAVKKHVFYSQQLDSANVQEELGDLMFYIQHFCNTIGLPLEYIISLNVEKLKRRYPNGYTDANAKLRLDKND